MMFLFWACGGNGLHEHIADVPRTAPWSELALPTGRTVVSGEDGLVVRYPTAQVDALNSEWSLALRAAGFGLMEDSGRAGMVASTWAREERRLGLSITAIRGTSTVSLQELP